jgi:hypothetical protein
VGFIHEPHGRITVETRRESFIVHTSYGYDASGNVHCAELGAFGKYWRDHPHPEFLLEDLDDLIQALYSVRNVAHEVFHGLT